MRDKESAEPFESCIRSNSSRSALHPFRDGNTRTQRAFFHQLTTEADWSIDWNGINTNMDQFRDARLVAHAGNHQPLHAVLTEHLSPAAPGVDPTGLAGPALD